MAKGRDKRRRQQKRLEKKGIDPKAKIKAKKIKKMEQQANPSS